MSGWKYDVFVSFRGEDIRKSFIDHLYKDFRQNGIRAFGDNIELPIGEEISPQLYKAIENSRFLIVIFSKNYASSSWCLRELVKILNSKQIEKPKHEVRILFYDVKPEVVRKQTESYAEAFAKHEVSDSAEVDEWKEALTVAASLSGWDLNDMTNGYESKFIDCISKDIRKTLRVMPLHVDENLTATLEELAPPTPDTVERVKKFLNIPVSGRTFCISNQAESSGSRDIEPTMSGSKRSSHRFSLQDLDAETQRKNSSEPSQPRTTNTHSKSSSRKRKTTEVIDVNRSFSPLDFDTTWRHGHVVLEQIARIYKDKLSKMEKLQGLVAAKSLLVDEKVAEIAKLKGDHARDVKQLKEEYAQEVNQIVSNAKTDAKVAIYQARVNMAAEASENGFDTSIWDVKSWKTKLAKLQGMNVVDEKEAIDDNN